MTVSFELGLEEMMENGGDRCSRTDTPGPAARTTVHHAVLPPFSLMATMSRMDHGEPATPSNSLVNRNVFFLLLHAAPPCKNKLLEYVHFSDIFQPQALLAAAAAAPAAVAAVSLCELGQSSFGGACID